MLRIENLRMRIPRKLSSRGASADCNGRQIAFIKIENLYSKIQKEIHKLCNSSCYEINLNLKYFVNHADE